MSYYSQRNHGTFYKAFGILDEIWQPHDQSAVPTVCGESGRAFFMNSNVMHSEWHHCYELFAAEYM
jgi:hypothetical protein